MIIQGDTLNELVCAACQALVNEGVKRDSRNGPVVELHNVELILRDPRQRHLCLAGRKNNIFATIAETIWVLAGLCSIDPVVSYFLPRARDYADDTLTWHDAYGPRLYGPPNQLDYVLQCFLTEGLDTRRAVITLWDPAYDTYDGADRLGRHRRLAVPCNIALMFWVQWKDGIPHFHARGIQRSADIIWGLSHVNIFEWTVVQEVLYSILRLTFNNLRLGSYHHSVINLHAYDSTAQQAQAVARANETQPHKLPVTPGSINANGNIKSASGLRLMFKNMYDQIAFEIESQIKGSLAPVQWDDTLAAWISILLLYLSADHRHIDHHLLNLHQHNPELWRAVMHSSYCPWGANKAPARIKA